MIITSRQCINALGGQTLARRQELIFDSFYMSKLPPLPPADENKPSGTDEAKAGAKANAKETSESLSKASQSLKDLASGKANIVDTALAVKGAVDAVKGLSGKLSASAMMPVMKKLAAFKGKAILPAGKQMDPVLGIDVHMVTIPPSPAPVPMPHPYIGLLFDPKDWISCLVNTFKKQALDAIPAPKEGATGVGASLAKNKEAIAGIAMGLAGLSASVKFGGFIPRAVAGTKTKNIPHIPMGAGFHPAFVATVAKNHGKAFLGSLFVAADGDPMVGSFHLNYDCWDVGIIDLFKSQRSGAKKKPEPGAPLAELYVPSGVVMPIPLGRPVLVNSIPTPINPMAILDKLFKAGLGKLKAAGRKAAQKGLDKLTGKVGCGALTKVSKLIGTGQSHPVDVAEGHFYTDNVDFSLPGPIPLAFERTWYSYSNYKGPLGYGWHHSYDMALAVDAPDGMAALRMSDGRVAGFKLPLNSKGTFNRGEKLTLIEHEDGYYYVTDNKGLIYRFTQKIYRNPYNKTEVHLLQSIANRNGFAIRFTYNDEGLLTGITDSADRKLEVFNDSEGHIIRIDAPHADIKGQSFPIARYAYSPEGDLSTQLDALDQPMQFEYRHHLMIREVWRNGCVWNFRYNMEKGIEAKCVEVWGNNNLLHYAFNYSRSELTVVTDSLGNEKLFYHKNGLVVKFVDPLQNAYEFRYNQFNEKELMIDPLGHQHVYLRDQYGNIIQSIEPNGAFTQVDYGLSAFPYLPTSSTDKLGGKWKFEYDDAGNLKKTIDPLGSKTVYEFKDGFLKSIRYNDVVTSKIDYDQMFNVTESTYEGGYAIYRTYDRTGNCTKTTDSLGNAETVEYDLVGNPTRINLPDGNVSLLKFDAHNNLIFLKDKTSEVSFAYDFLSNKVLRVQGGKMVRYKYDTEGNLRTIINEHGDEYLFDLDSNGDVVQERSFDGVIRKYERDGLGRISQITRPEGRFSKFKYNDIGKITEVRYHDDTFEKFTYRHDGELKYAENLHSRVLIEKDVYGRTIQESTGDRFITNEYDLFANLTRSTSSFGLDVANGFDLQGNLKDISINSWSANIDYDLLGFPTHIVFPGGVENIWSRNQLGKPSQQIISNGSNEFRKRKFTWGFNSQLTSITDSLYGVSRFRYDNKGQITETSYGNESLQLRNPDAVGNLYATKERTDRVYDKAGKLVKAQGLRYRYDCEGNLIEKIKSNGESWKYSWTASGYLESVTRPDKQVVYFQYDAFGRRISKNFKNTVTRWLWNMDKPVHEWKERANVMEFETSPMLENSLVGWIYEQDSYTPIGKVKGEKHYSIIKDHLDTPIQMFHDDGSLVWEGELDSYGKIRIGKGDQGSCPFRYQGQYEDVETGLYYNRFRYYAPEEGIYVSSDPVGLTDRLKMYAYVSNPNILVDIFGLQEGGSYYGTRSTNDGGEVNHIPAYASYKNEPGAPGHGAGPAVWMETADHRKTMSCGSSTEAQKHRAKQNMHIKQGQWGKAIEMDIKDIQGQFGKKYNAGLKQLIDRAHSAGLIDEKEAARLKKKCK